MTEAALWGLLTSGSLLVGSLVALLLRPGTRAIGATLAFGAGALISAVSYELVLDAFETDARSAALGFTLGALAFFAGDTAIDRFGGHGRKSMTGEAQASGSPLAIVLGTVLDGIPESVILGATLVEGGAVSVAFVVAVFVSNVPEAVSGTSGLLKAGWRRGSVLGLWCAVVAISTVAAAIGWLAFDQLPALDGATLLGFAAGAMLVMVADTLMPEAFEHAGRVAGLFTTLGFAVSFALTQYG